jgi:hypothetical protein
MRTCLRSSTAAVLIKSTSALRVRTRINHPHYAPGTVLRSGRLHIARTSIRQGGRASLQGHHGRERLGDKGLSVTGASEGEHAEDGQANAGTSGGSERERSGGARHDLFPLRLLSND